MSSAPDHVVPVVRGKGVLEVDVNCVDVVRQLQWHPSVLAPIVRLDIHPRGGRYRPRPAALHRELGELAVGTVEERIAAVEGVTLHHPGASVRSAAVDAEAGLAATPRVARRPAGVDDLVVPIGVLAVDAVGCVSRGPTVPDLADRAVFGPRAD